MLSAALLAFAFVILVPETSSSQRISHKMPDTALYADDPAPTPCDGRPPLVDKERMHPDTVFGAPGDAPANTLFLR